MTGSKLINVLRTFSKSEMKEFEKFVSSPTFNKGRNYMPFLNELKKFHPKFDNEKMTPEYIFSKMYRDKKFNKQIIWNMNSALYKIAEEFLVYISLKKNKFERNMQLNKELLDRKLAAIYYKKLEEMEDELDRIGIGSSFFLYKTFLESGRIAYEFLEDRQHLIPPHMAKKGEYGILNFLKFISSVISDMNSNTEMFNARFEVNIAREFINNLKLDNVIEYAKKNKMAYAYIMEMYYLSIMMILKPAENPYFNRFREILGKHYDEFVQEERKSWLAMLSNYCSRRINYGDDDYRDILFEVNNLQLKEIETSRKKELGKILYYQILRNSISTGRYDWAKTYIEKYTPYLKLSYQKSMRALANAFLSFKLKEFNKVIENLGKVRFIDSRDKFYVKSLYIRTYYELGEIPTLLYQIDASKQFINTNNSLGRSTRVNFNNFLNFMNRFLILKENNNTVEMEILKHQIEKDNSLINGIWLLEKIDEIKKGAN